MVEPLGPKRILKIFNFVKPIAHRDGIAQKIGGHLYESNFNGSMFFRSGTRFICWNWGKNKVTLRHSCSFQEATGEKHPGDDNQRCAAQMQPRRYTRRHKS